MAFQQKILDFQIIWAWILSTFTGDTVLGNIASLITIITFLLVIKKLVTKSKGTKHNKKSLEKETRSGINLHLKKINSHVHYRDCEIEGCNRKHAAMGYCYMHYIRLRNSVPVN